MSRLVYHKWYSTRHKITTCTNQPVGSPSLPLSLARFLPRQKLASWQDTAAAAAAAAVRSWSDPWVCRWVSVAAAAAAGHAVMEDEGLAFRRTRKARGASAKASAAARTVWTATAAAVVVVDEEAAVVVVVVVVGVGGRRRAIVPRGARWPGGRRTSRSASTRWAQT